MCAHYKRRVVLEAPVGSTRDNLKYIIELHNSFPALIERLELLESALDEANAGYFSNWLVNQSKRGTLGPKSTIKEMNDAYKERVKAHDPALAKLLEEK